MTKSSLYRLEVAPVIILPLEKSPFFSYVSDNVVPLGSLVAISFGKQHILGIVYTCALLPGNPSAWMKAITRVVAPSFLSDEQRALAEMISTEYFTPLGKTLKHFLPKITKERSQGQTSHQHTIASLSGNKTEKAILTQFMSEKNLQPFFLDTTTLLDPKHFFALVGKKLQTNSKQTLIIVPELMMLPSLEDTFRGFFPAALAILHSKLSHGAYFSAWERVRSGEATIIIGTRQALFTPFKNLGVVIMTEEQDESYKQWDMSPRYHSKRVATWLASLHHGKLLLTSPTPSIEILLAAQEKTITLLGTLTKYPSLKNKLTIVNLRLERYRKNTSPLSLELIERLRTGLIRQEQSLLYINRQGMNAFSVCEGCKEIFRCPSCGSPLSSTKEGYFRCLSCSYKTSLFPNCPSCGHLSFKHIGFGTERIEKELRRLFPNAAIARVDSSTLGKTITGEVLYTEGMAGRIDIIVGTQMVLKDPPLPKLSLVAMIDADSLLLFPDFQADERLFQSLSRARLQVGNGTVVVQTFHPESAFLQRVTAMDGSTFSLHLLAEREALFYPPYARIIAVILTGKTEAAVAKTTLAICERLETVLLARGKVHASETARFLKRQLLFEKTIIVRLPNDKPLSEKLITLLRQISKDGIVDVDPLALR